MLGGCVIVLASFLAGATGFGFALISTPLLLLIGFPLEFVVTANLTLTLITRIPVSYRFRTHVSLRRALMLILGSIPGFYLGARVLASVDASAINVAAGVAVMVVALLLGFSASKPPPWRYPVRPWQLDLQAAFSAQRLRLVACRQCSCWRTRRLSRGVSSLILRSTSFFRAASRSSCSLRREL